MEVSIVKQDGLALDATSPDAVHAHPFRPAFIDRLYINILKRCFDIVGALALLILLSPVWILAAILIVCESPGDVIFRQIRVGRSQKLFTCYKFRSMVVDAERLLMQNDILRGVHATNWKISADPRVTRFGRFMRTTSIDELPQLINVLKGDMSLVGPRPVQPKEFEERYNHVADVIAPLVPGITGLWQVSGRSNTTYDERIALDLEYAAKFSLKQDLKILLMTIPVLLLRVGAH